MIPECDELRPLFVALCGTARQLRCCRPNVQAGQLRLCSAWIHHVDFDLAVSYHDRELLADATIHTWSRTMSIYQPGDHVKVEFADDASGESEWMWLQVDSSDDQSRIVFGRLDSQPVVHSELKVGQELAVSYDEIRDHR